MQGLKNSPYAAYGDNLRPVRPGRPARRSPVIKLGGTGVDYIVPGPGAYTPVNVGSPRLINGVMGEKKARKSSVEPSRESPGPVYQMRSSVERQDESNKASSPRFGFGTQPRIVGATVTASGPGPGAYSPRVTNHAEPSSIQTVAAGQLTEMTTPRGSVQLTEGTWSRKVNRSLARVSNFPSPSSTAYTPSDLFTTHKMPAYTMRALGTRAGLGGATAADSPGPLSYHPAVKSRFGGGQMGDSPRYSFADRNENIPTFQGKVHARIYQGKHSPSPAAYTPLEEFGVTSYTISNTSTHAPMFQFGSEARPCAP